MGLVSNLYCTRSISISLGKAKNSPIDTDQSYIYTIKMCVCLSVCILRLGERLDGFAQLFLEVVGDVQGSVS